MKIQWSILILVLILEACTGVQKPIDVYMVGDSTMSNKKAEVYPETGWGQVFDEFFDEQVTVHNHAVNGRSTKSFITEGRWQTVLDSLKQGDYVFIQFGHNDQKDQDSARYTDPYGTYSQNLEKYVRESRDKGATPILLTSIVRRKFDENGQLLDTHGDYPLAMRAVAKELDVDLVQSMGDEPSKEVYLWTEPNDRFPEGRQDDTHLRVVGAKKVAELVANELVKLPNDLAGRVVQQN